MTIRIKLYIGFLILILIFIVDFFVNQGLSGNVNRNSEFLGNSENIIRNSNVIHKNIISMQSGFRGFLLTDNKIFLQPYYDGLKSVPPLILLQKQLVNNPGQIQILDSISSLHALWIDYANTLITTKTDTVPESYLKYRDLLESKVKKEVGKKLNDEIATLFETFDNNEYKVRQERRAALFSSITYTRNITLLLTGLSILIAIISSVYIIRFITKRISKMVRFASEISRGNFITINDNKDDELKTLSESLNSMSNTLDQSFKELNSKNYELDQFAYVVSHDLKAPLRGIDNITKWMIEDHGHDITPDLRSNIELIKGRTHRLENMINGLLEYARIGKMRKGVELVDTDKMVRELVSVLVPHSFKVTIEGEMPVLKAEKIRLEQVFSNLISNAYKHNNQPEGRIIIKSADAGQFYEFTISDNGPGIKKEYFEKIFIIFQTLQERDAFESTGVGLAIVKKIINEQKAEIRVESELGKGTSFIFTWPKQPIT
jgi:signal transduction histidine kinase